MFRMISWIDCKAITIIMRDYAFNANFIDTNIRKLLEIMLK